RLERRAGIEALMPNLQFSSEEIDALIAFLKYTSKINTSGWPPKVIADKSVINQKADELEQKSGLYNEQTYAPVPNEASESENTEIQGVTLFNNLGCAACHSIDGSKVVGPTLKNIYQSEVTLTD